MQVYSSLYASEGCFVINVKVRKFEVLTTKHSLLCQDFRKKSIGSFLRAPRNIILRLLCSMCHFLSNFSLQASWSSPKHFFVGVSWSVLIKNIKFRSINQYLFDLDDKGQLISKCLFGVSNSPKKWTWKLKFLP